MNKREFIKGVAGLSTIIAAPTIAGQMDTEPQPNKPGIGYNDYFASMFTRDPIWFTVYGVVFEIHELHRTWHRTSSQELEASNISLPGLLAAKVGVKFQESKCIAGFKHNQITTTVRQFTETESEPFRQGVSGWLYRVQAPVENRGMVEIQSMYVVQQGPYQHITETPLVMASIGLDKYLLSTNNSMYHTHMWSLYKGVA